TNEQALPISGQVQSLERHETTTVSRPQLRLVVDGHAREVNLGEGPTHPNGPEASAIRTHGAPDAGGACSRYLFPLRDIHQAHVTRGVAVECEIAVRQSVHVGDPAPGRIEWDLTRDCPSGYVVDGDAVFAIGLSDSKARIPPIRPDNAHRLD